MLSRMTTTTTPRRAGQFRRVGEKLISVFIKRDLLCGLPSQWQADLEKSRKPKTGNSPSASSRKNWKSTAGAKGTLRGMTLQELITTYENQLAQSDERTQDNRKSVLKKFRATWNKSFDIPVRSITSARMYNFPAEKIQRTNNRK